MLDSGMARRPDPSEFDHPLTADELRHLHRQAFDAEPVARLPGVSRCLRSVQHGWGDVAACCGYSGACDGVEDPEGVEAAPAAAKGLERELFWLWPFRINSSRPKSWRSHVMRQCSSSLPPTIEQSASIVLSKRLRSRGIHPVDETEPSLHLSTARL